MDQLKSRLGSAIIVLALGRVCIEGLLVAGVTPDLTGACKAGELIGAVAAQVDGKGGGRADFAQAGGSQARSGSTGTRERGGEWVRGTLA